METRQTAIKWWDNLYSDPYFNPYNKKDLCTKYYGKRRYHSLTGREIENIYTKETEND